MKTIVKYFLGLIFILMMFSSSVAQLHHRDKPLPCLNKTFYIHVHVVLDPDRVAGVDPTALDMALAEASEYFKPICAEFKVCAFDTIQNYNHASISPGGREPLEMVAKFQVHNRINLYLVDAINVQCGHSIYESILDPTSAALFIVKSRCTNGTVIAHELGHLFGLFHTYHRRYSEFVDGSNCTTEGDQICDTPADPYIPGDTTGGYAINCEFIHLRLDPNDQYYQPLIGNIMSAYGCPCGFTYDQFERMANNYLNSTDKIW